MADSSKNSDSPLEGWTKEEKFYLLQSMKAYGSNDIERIHAYIQTKTPEQIMIAIDHYKEIASKHPVFDKIAEKTKKSYKPRVALSKWASLLTDNVPIEELKTETSTAVRMIAELEEMPDPVFVDNIDFRKIYHTIADAMEGKTLTPDSNTVAVLNKCIMETASASKAILKTSSYKSLINSIDFSDKNRHTFPKVTEDRELTVLRNLISQRGYNPLGISEEFMKSSFETVMKEDD